MKHPKKRVNVLLVVLFCIWMLVLAACGGPNPQQTETPEKEAPPADIAEAKEVTVVDAAGQTVVLPRPVESAIVTCYGGVSHELAILGVADKIVAQPSMDRFKPLVKMYPDFKNIPDVGSFDKVNPEEIARLKPHVVFASFSSEQGNQKIRELGIPVVAMLTGKADSEGLKKEITMVGEIFGKEKQAKAFVDYWDNSLKMLEDMTSKIPQEQRKKVYYMLGDILHTNGGNWWGQQLIEAAGGINVAEEIGGGRDISMEQLLLWNPDVIIISSNEGRFIPFEEIKENPKLKDLKAVKNNQLYQCPIGSFWWDRPSPESPLGFMWLSSVLYPEATKELDLKKEAMNFYQQFYNYELSEEEYQEFLNPQG